MNITSTSHLMRVHQYIKNLFIFLPAFFSFRIFDLMTLLYSSLAFGLFCLCASSIYIVNDILDVQQDRLHPYKCHRPIASGKIQPKTALILAGVLFIIGGGGGYLLDPNIFLIFLFYVLINLFYSFKLKHIAILDIFIIAIGFVLRLFVGAVAINTFLSEWIILMTFLLALFLALAKRRDDVILSEKNGKKMRKVIDGYNQQFLDIAMAMSATIVVIAYILWSISPEVQERLHSKYLYVSGTFVLAGIFRYMQITFVENKSGSPTRIVLKDRFLQSVIICWFISLLILIYI